MKMEEHFKETLNRAVANEPPVLDAWDRFEQRVGRGRRVRLLAAITAAAAIAVASVIVVPKLATNDSIKVPPATQPPTADPYEGWQTFTNPDQHYRLKFPADWKRSMFEAVNEFGPAGLPATDARGAEMSFGVIINLLPANEINPPLTTKPGAPDGVRANNVDVSHEGTVLVVTRLIDWSASRCITLETACPEGDALILTARINGEDSSEFMGKYRELADLIVQSLEYVP